MYDFVAMPHFFAPKTLPIRQLSIGLVTRSHSFMLPPNTGIHPTFLRYAPQRGWCQSLARHD